MSIVVYSINEIWRIEDRKYRKFDESFFVPTELSSYEVNQYVIVVFEDSINDVENLMVHLKTNASSDDYSFHSIRGNTELTETEHTPYKGVKRLMPTHKLSKNWNQDINTKKFWSIRNPNSDQATQEELIDQFYGILQEIVQKYVSDQKNIGCEISGGLDSSSIACLAARLKDKDSRMYGYTYLFDQSTDGDVNKDKVDIIYQDTTMTPQYFNLSNYWSFKDTKYGIKFYDEPSPLILNFAMFRDLNNTAKNNNVNILLSGEGGDELLSSSTHYVQDLFFQGQKKQVLYQLMKAVNKKKQPIWKIFCTHLFPAFLPSRLRYKFESKMNKPTWQNTGFYLSWYHTPDWIGDKLRKVTYEEVEVERQKIRDSNIESIYLKENFERLMLVNPCPWLNNNFGKPAGLSRIYPFRDQRLVEFLFSLPSLTKREMSHKKKCIKEGFRNMIPKEILLKPDKSQFVEIYRKGYFKESSFVNEMLRTSRLVDFGWIDKRVFQNAIERFKYGFDEEFSPISKVFGLELWLRHHGY
jgi:asparagine synthetase B (glutamine-hydrolysing)